MLKNLKKSLERVNSINTYIYELEKLAESNSYTLVNEFHYMVNKKLGITSKLKCVCESAISNHVTYCAKCGEYLHHNNMWRASWYIEIEGEDIFLHYTPWKDDDYEEELCFYCESEEYLDEYIDDEDYIDDDELPY